MITATEYREWAEECLEWAAEAATLEERDFLYFCPTCKAVYEIVRHRIRPPTEPICERCQRDLPIAEEGDWLTYRRTGSRFERTGQLLT